MKTAVFLLAVGALVSIAAVACSQSNTASSELKDASDAAVGEATLTAADETGVVGVTIDVRGLPAGTHGVHIHDVGRCDPPDFTTAGGHYNPSRKRHGLEDPDGPHNGDLPNLVVEPDGTGTLQTVNRLLADLPGDENLFDGDGVALVIHAGPDDHVTDPSGGSGDRIACGVIRHD